jgi:predicted Zn-dependent protease
VAETQRLDQLTSILRRTRGADEWVARAERVRTISRSIGAGRETSLGETTNVRAQVYRDLRRGRGAAGFVARADEEDLTERVANTAERARYNIDVAWRMPLPAASARVEVADEQAFADPLGAVDQVTEALLDAAAAAKVSLTRFAITLMAGEVELRTSGLFASHYRHTLIEVRAWLDAGTAERAATAELWRRARRPEDLGLAAGVASAATHARDYADAARLAPGIYDLVFPGEVTLGEDPKRYGLLDPLVRQSSATLARQGLSRFHIGQALMPAIGDGDPLTVRSDGTIDHGLYSAPFGELGEPVRAFDLVRAGVAAGHPLDLREAALRRVTPNGGVRNLVVDSGRAPGAALRRPLDRPLIELAQLAWLDTDARTGAFVAEIGLGYALMGDRRQPITGGALRGNSFELLARTRRSRERIEEGWYYGPAWLRVDELTIE